MAYRTSEETALLVCWMFHRAGLSRARTSQKTIKKISGRTRLKAAFVTQVMDSCADLNLAMIELDGAYGLIPSSALMGAKSITTTSIFTKAERASIMDGSINVDAISEELGISSTDDEDDA